MVSYTAKVTSLKTFYVVCPRSRPAEGDPVVTPDLVSTADLETPKVVGFLKHQAANLKHLKMPSLLPRSPLVPDCVACCRSLARLGLSAPATGTLQQTRGKKKNAKPVTQITVRLVKDLPGYGRKGTRR